MPKQKLSEVLTPRQIVEAGQLSKYFPSLARGHGSTHKLIRDEVTPGHEDDIIGHRCVAKDCDTFRTGHTQLPINAAADFILERDA